MTPWEEADARLRKRIADLEALIGVDYRMTSGGTRTETMASIPVGRTVIINWQLKNTSGGAADMTFGLPATGNYSGSVFASTQGGFDTMAMALGAPNGEIRTKGSAPGGSTAVLYTGMANNNAISVFGVITRDS